jgi:hypothetical protein
MLKKPKKTNVCSHPKHKYYISTALHSVETKTFKKAPERLIKFFELSQGAMMCRHCLYKTDDDPEYVNLPSTRKDIIYSDSEFQELESAYNEACMELDKVKLGK